MSYIEEHQDDKDFNDPLELESIEFGATKVDTRTPEEIQLEAEKLQQQLHESFIRKEKEREADRERNQAQFTKDLVRAKKEQEENQLAKDLREREFIKNEHANAYKKQKELIAREHAARFGTDYKPNEGIKIKKPLDERFKK